MIGDPAALSAALEALASVEVARKAMHEVRPLRGVRGTPQAEVAKLAIATWAEHQPALPADAEALDALYRAAWEDGLLAVALLAAVLPDAPEAALELGTSWAETLDDLVTADALGWLVLGPGALATRRTPDEALGELRGSGRPAVRRAACMAGMALTPEIFVGAGGAALRARLGTDAVRIVEEAQDNALADHCAKRVRDLDPAVQKGLRRVLLAWAADHPLVARDFVLSFPGGVPKMQREAVLQATAKADRRRE